jgi:hypothetical protein
MTYYYAQINPSSVCFAILQTYAEITDEDMILIPAYDESYLGKRWTGTSWEDVPQPDVEPSNNV